MKFNGNGIFENSFLHVSGYTKENILPKIDASDSINFPERKDLYLYAAVKGKEYKSKPLIKPDSVARASYYNTDIEYITKLLALSVKEIKENNKTVEESLYDKNIVINADRFAETGFGYIKNDIEKLTRPENEYLRKLDELDDLYKKYVNED